MLGPSAALIGADLGKSVALVTDGRFSGATHGMLFAPKRVIMDQGPH